MMKYQDVHPTIMVPNMPMYMTDDQVLPGYDHPTLVATGYWVHLVPNLVPKAYDILLIYY